MYYKLSNTASKETLEKSLGRPFKYPQLYNENILINGFEEATIPVVSMNEKDVITPAIWGILPQNYQEDWSIFQNICNTLNTPLESMSTNLWYAKSLINKRCLIPVTGFFTSYLSNGVIHPFYFTRDLGLPFCLAGIYTVLDDGFLSCSIITCNADDIIRRVHNVGQTMPMILDEELHSAWLQEGVEMNEIKEILHTPHNYQIKSYPIARDFYKNNISYQSMLEPVFYDSVPTGLT
ncbi:SOS response-associated peptidase [Maribacter sp. 2307UL18-2]|uniref:SOS response-associated peptidase n=1 Tax=Maribacter sp. 2307UL18-2 TaxID=3386274 RepID=UPI0039BCF853